MTLDELATFSGEQLKALTDKELEEILRPYFKVTRPELVPKKIVQVQQQIYLSPQKQKAIDMLKEEGLDMDFLKRRKKR